MDDKDTPLKQTTSETSFCLPAEEVITQAPAIPNRVSSTGRRRSSHRVSVLFGEEDRELIRDEVLPELFRDTAIRFPEKVALRFGSEALTFAEIDAASDRLAAALHAVGAAPGRFVGIFHDRSPAVLIATLGIMKAGAAFVPFDPGAPPDRVATSLADCEAVALLVDAERERRTSALTLPRLRVDALAHATAEPIDWRALGLDRNHPCYVIYTSGTTGKPKGIVVAHRNICHLARSENAVLGIRENDVVWHGASPAFDVSIEEVWLAWLVGATVVMATPEEARALDRLPETLAQRGVTVLSTVPSLAAMFERDIPSLRLLDLGGEPLPPMVIERWWRPDLKIVNTYGPTETTICATATLVQLGEPVTIGRPLPNYAVYILNDDGMPKPIGEPGELCIGGSGVSLGYIGRNELMAEKFVPDPFGDEGAIMYRSGDQASIDELGRIVFHGRIDGQVKLRGYRIELEEIEAVLSSLPQIKASVCAVRKDAAGNDHLIAFVVVREGAAIDPPSLRSALAAKLPGYMVPSHINPIDELPRLPSGKINRKALPDAEELTTENEDRDLVVPRTPTECALVDAWKPLFPDRRVGVTDDFFAELGGHSLTIATYVSRLRKDARFRTVSLQDVYATRNIAALAERIDRAAPAAAKPVERRTFLPVSRLRYLACGAAQAVSMLALGALATLTMLAVLAAYRSVYQQASNHFIAGLVLVSIFMAVPPLAILLSVAGKWVIIGRYRPGEYPLWGFYYWRHWLVSHLMIPAGYVAGTPLYSVYLRLLGAKIGRDCYIDRLQGGPVDLVSIGEHTSLGRNVALSNAVVEDGLLKIGRIAIGAHCCVGSSAVLGRDTSLGDWSEIDEFASLADSVAVPAGEVWGGSSARCRGKADRIAAGAPEPVSRKALIGIVAMYSVLIFLLFPLWAVLPAIPVLVILAALLSESFVGAPAIGLGLLSYLASTPALALLSVLLVAIEIVALRWLLLRRVKEGVYRVASWFYIRKWAVDRLLDASLVALYPVYASLYLPPWYRALGVKVGRRAEISDASSITPDLLEIRDEAFVADAVSLGDSHVRHGRLTLRRTRVGRRTFLGNTSLVPDGTDVPDEVLLGCLSTPPKGTGGMRPGSTWFGIPGSPLPARQMFTGYPEHLTFRPTAGRIAGRLAVELFRIVLPGAVAISLTMLLIVVAASIHNSYSTLAMVASLPLLYPLMLGIPALLITALFKWLFIGRYRPTQVPIWTRFVWFSEAVTTIYESLAVPTLLRQLKGTPFLAPCLRLLGVKIGRRVFLDTTQFTEFDMISIGDEAALNDDCVLQTHLFEDRIMKIGPVEIDRRAVVGAHAIVLYDARMEAESHLGAHSLVMKGETLPAATTWFGSPAEPAL